MFYRTAAKEWNFILEKWLRQKLLGSVKTSGLQTMAQGLDLAPCLPISVPSGTISPTDTNDGALFFY